MHIHGKVTELIAGPAVARQNTLLVITAEGDGEPHAFYLTPEAVQDLRFKLLCPLQDNHRPALPIFARVPR